MNKESILKLVRSLSGAEKRYFSIWTTRHYDRENNITLQLFSDLVKWKGNDLKLFARENAHRSYARNFRFNKFFLYGQLLRCLHQFHSGRNAEAQLKEMLDHADILAEKGLVEESLALLGKASALGLKYECFGIYYEVKRKELELFRDINYKGVPRERIPQVEKEMQEVLKQAGTLARREATIMQLLHALAQGGIQRGEVLAQAKTLAKTLGPLKDEKTFRTALLHCQGMGAIDFSKGNFKSTWKWTRSVLELFDRFPHMKTEKKKAYVVALQNHLVTANYLNHHEQLESILAELEKVKADSPQLKSRIFYMTHNMMLGTCAQVGDYVRGLKLIREINAAHRKGEVQYLNPQNEMIQDFNSALVYFGTGRYREANAAINRITDVDHGGVRQDLQSFARILSILIQFESGKQDLLEYSVRSAYRFLLKKKNLFEVEKVIIRFLKNSARHMSTAKDQAEAFAKLKKELQSLKRRRSEEQPFRFFDLLAWLDSKLERKYLGTVLREKNPAYWKP